jgi:hypothetical protein
MFSNITNSSDVEGFINDLSAALSTEDKKLDLSLALPSLKSLLSEYSPDIGEEVSCHNVFVHDCYIKQILSLAFHFFR